MRFDEHLKNQQWVETTRLIMKTTSFKVFFWDGFIMKHRKNNEVRHIFSKKLFGKSKVRKKIKCLMEFLLVHEEEKVFIGFKIVDKNSKKLMFALLKASRLWHLLRKTEQSFIIIFLFWIFEILLWRIKMCPQMSRPHKCLHVGLQNLF